MGLVVCAPYRLPMNYQGLRTAIPLAGEEAPPLTDQVCSRDAWQWPSIWLAARALVQAELILYSVANCPGVRICMTWSPV